jgi:tetratricopeptide (TPR) repeat protein
VTQKIQERPASVGPREFSTGAKLPGSGRVSHLQQPSQDRDDILFGRPDRLKVFISSEMRSRSLEKERCAAAEAVDEHPDAQAWMWERSAHAGSYSSLEVCRGHAATSDLLILIVSNTLTYATEIEWRAAKATGASCAIFAMEGANRDTRLTAFLEAERDTAIYVHYRDASDLKRRIGETLRQSHTSAIRKGVLRRRRVAHIGSIGTSHLLEAGLASAEQQLWSGSAVVAAEVIAELENLFGDQEDGREDLDLVSGRVHGVLGERARAAKAYERVIARQDHSLIGAAIAQQNLGVEALKRRDFVQSRELMKDALRRHLECENWFGVVQMLLNLATLSAMEGELVDASELADLVQQLMAELDKPLPHQAASLLGLRGYIAAHEGRPSDALELYRQGWKKAQRLGDREVSCVCSQNIGSAYADLKRPAMATKWYKRALSIARGTGNVWRQEELHRALALAAYRTGNFTSALEHFESARALAERINDRWLVGTLTADIGAMLTLAGDFRATDELDKAAVLIGEFADAEWLYRVEKNRGALARKAGDRTRAATSLRRALGYANSADARRDVHEGLAFLYLDSPVDETAAFEEFLVAADCATQAGEADKAWLLGIYGAHLTNAGCPSSAIRIFDLAISVGQAAGDTEVLFHLRNDLGLALVDYGDLAKARDMFQNGVNWARTERKRALEVQALHNLGETQRRTGDLVASRESLVRAVELSKDLGDDIAWRSALGLLAMTELAEGLIDEAERHAKITRDAARQVKDKANEATATGTLAGIEFRRGNYDVAAETYRTAARLDRDQPVHYCEDLMGILESNAAADDWRRTIRAAQRVVDYAQKRNFQNLAWPSLLRAARWYLDRGRSKRAGLLAAPAVVLAFQSVETRQDSFRLVAKADNASTAEELGSEMMVGLGQILKALLTLGFYVKLSPQGSALDMWEFLFDEVAHDSSQLRDSLRRLVAMAEQAVAECDLGEHVSTA